MKLPHTLSLLFFMSLIVYIGVLKAQPATNFTLIDTDSTQWNLFDQLDSGKAVVLDFFFVDCVPCQTWTPEMVQMYTDLGGDTGNVLVLGISDRDSNDYIQTFDQTYNVNYPSGGIEGNGDDITDTYTSSYVFFGWPTYAVVCPNRNVFWDLKKETGFPEIRQRIDSCKTLPPLSVDKIPEKLNIVVYPNPTSDKKIIIDGFNPSESHCQVELFSLVGEKVYSGNHSITSYKTLPVTLPGIPEGRYLLRIETEGGLVINKRLILN